MKSIVITIISIMFAGTAIAQQTALEKKIIDLEHKWVDVALKHDAKAFAAMMSDNYVRMNPDGSVGYKKPWVDAVRSGKTKYHYVYLYDMKVTPQGQTAIVTGKFTQKATKATGEEEVAGTFMNTWQQQKGQWKIISSSFYITEDLKKKQTAQNADSAKIVELEHKWIQVAIDGDADTFSNMMADNYVGLYPNGRLGRKENWVNNIRSGRNKYEYVKLSDLKVYINGETAVVTGKYDEKAFIARNERLSKGSYMGTWAKVNGEWKVVANAFTDDPK